LPAAVITETLHQERNCNSTTHDFKVDLLTHLDDFLKYFLTMFSSGPEEAGAGDAEKHVTFWSSISNGLNIRHICINTKVNQVFYKFTSLVPVTVRELL
jgi:hypothetical protein